MGRPRRRVLTGEREAIWQGWRAGHSLVKIAGERDRTPGVIFSIIRGRGGVSPGPRRRSAMALTLAEREEISRGLSAGMPIRWIARQIGRAPSTVSREVGRNGGRTDYRAAQAEERAWDRARRPKPCKLSTERRLRMLVTKKLEHNWAPEQIAGWLKAEFPANPAMQISHETIYRSLFIQARGLLKKELVSHLRSKRAARRPGFRRSRGGFGRGERSMSGTSSGPGYRNARYQPRTARRVCRLNDLSAPLETLGSLLNTGRS